MFLSIKSYLIRSYREIIYCQSSIILAEEGEGSCDLSKEGLATILFPGCETPPATKKESHDYHFQSYNHPCCLTFDLESKT